MKFLLSIYNNKQVFLLSLIFMQTAGIRFFQGMGTVFMLIVFLFNIKYISLVKLKSLFYLVLFILFFIIIQLFKNSEIQFTINTLIIIISSFFFTLPYINNESKFLDDLSITLKLFVGHAFITFFVYFIFRPLEIQFHAGVMDYSTIFYIFYYFGDIADLSLRMSGMFWEPGCMQLFANLFLFICIFNGYKLKKLLWIIFVVMSTVSSTGFVILAVNGMYYIFKNFSIRRIWISLIPISLFTIFIVPSVYNLVAEKWNNDLSGISRQINTIAGIQIAFNHPFIGVKDDLESLMNNSEYNIVEEDIHGAKSDMLSYNFGTIPGGFTNGFLGLMLKWGTIPALLLYFLYFRSSFFPSSKFAFWFLFIYIISNMTEALTDTSLFYIFVMSVITIGIRRKNLEEKEIGENVSL